MGYEPCGDVWPGGMLGGVGADRGPEWYNDGGCGPD